MSIALSIIAIVVAIAALAIAVRKKPREIIKEQVIRVDRAPVEHPFTYDNERATYTLDGSLEVTGGLAAYARKEGR